MLGVAVAWLCPINDMRKTTMAMFVNWHDLQGDGRDRHSALLAEATRRRLARQFDRKETTVQEELDDAQSIGLAQGSTDDELRQRGKFTAREWQRLIFLRWLYRRGDLTD
jgi:hypothetical protein